MVGKNISGLALAPGGGKKAGKKTATDSFVALQI